MYTIKCTNCGKWFSADDYDDYEGHFISSDRCSFKCPNCKTTIWKDCSGDKDDGNFTVDDDKDEYAVYLSNEVIPDEINKSKWEEALEDAEVVEHQYAGTGLYIKAFTQWRWANELEEELESVDENDKKYNELEHNILSLREDALDAIDSSIKHLKSEPDAPEWMIPEARLLKGKILSDQNNYVQARNAFIQAMENDSSNKEAKEMYSYTTQKVIEEFNTFTGLDSFKHHVLEDEDYSGLSEKEKEEKIQDAVQWAKDLMFCNRQSFADRQFIFIVKNESKIAGCVDPKQNINWVFTQDQLPADIYFPLGHPIPNTLYVAHLAKKGYYLPFEGAEDKMFDDKIEQFCRLAQCLGAEEISFRSLKGKAVTQSELSSMAIDAQGSIKITKGSIQYTENQGHKQEQTSSRQMMFSIKYNSNNKPYCPDDLEWLKYDQTWQNFVKQRLEGNITTYTKRISSSETVNLTSNRKKSIKGSFQYLMAKAEAGYEEEYDKTFSSSENSEWEINVTFKSLNDYPADTSNLQIRTNQLTEKEIIYKNDILYYLEDGFIGDVERKALNRKMKKLGIDEKRAAEIEEMCIPKLSEEESEYLETFKEIAGNEDEISPRVRKILDREAEHLGLSSERIKALENMNK